MSTRNVSICVFYDKKTKNILIQERDKNSKVGEGYGFWGGGIEEGETKEQALYRELKEELNYKPDIIQYLYNTSIKVHRDGLYKDCVLNIDVFISPITNELRKCKVYEGKDKVEINIEKALELKERFLEHDDKILMKVREEILQY